jgi:hypothetical protein
MSLWSSPNPPVVFKPAEQLDQTAFIIVGGLHEAISTRSFGDKPAVRATVVMLTGPLAGSVHEDTLLFQSSIVSQLRDEEPGTVKLVRIVRNGERGVRLDPPTGYDDKLANAFVADNPGALEKLRDSALRNFEDACRQMVMATQQQRPTVSPQFKPPAVAEGNATLDSMRTSTTDTDDGVPF